jgi:hypothetical protein
MMEEKWCCQPLEVPVTTSKRKDTEQRNVPIKILTQGKFKGECNNCGKIGHKKSDCWQLEENKNKRPEDYLRGNAEHGNTAISSGTGDEDSDAEFLVCAVQYEEEGANDKDIATLDEEHEYDEDETFDFVSEKRRRRVRGQFYVFRRR